MVKEYDTIKQKNRGIIIHRKKKRKSKESVKLLSRGEILSFIDKIPEAHGNFKTRGLMYRALVSLIYLTGARVSELLTLKKEQLEFTCTEKENQKYLIINNVPTLKRKEKIFRALFLRKDFEDPFIKHLLAWLPEVLQEEKIFNINSSRAYQIIFKYTGMYPHYFRHVRNTDLVRYYGLNSHYLRAWNGWKSIRSSEFYVSLANEDLKDRILKANINRIG